jgi:TPP-dependent pyruvate/acetoin dehydrogenase alpha subunit
VKETEAFPVTGVDEIFKYVFAEMTPQLKEQLEYLKTTLR